MNVATMSCRCWVALLTLSSFAWAAPDPAPTPVRPEAPAPAASSLPAEAAPDAPANDARDEASAAFTRGQALLREQAYEEALAEFERAYALSPLYPVLYFIGAMNVRLERWANARRAFELYLKLGGAELAPDRAEEVRVHLDELSRKTVTLTLTLNVPQAGARIHVDGSLVEPTQVSGLILDPGEHVVRVEKPGFKPLEQMLRATDGENVHLVLPLARSGEMVTAEGPPLVARPAPPVAAEPSVPLWVPWAITGTLAAGWATTAALAIKARHDRDAIETPGTPEQEIEDAQQLHKTLAVVSDILLVSTLASAGVSAYLTWWPEPDAPASRAADGWAIGVAGRF